MREEIFKASDGKEICLVVWDAVKQPQGVVQIVHGMGEHIRRYDDFAGFLNENGYIVAGDDHRAHGKTALMRDNTITGAEKDEDNLGTDEGDIAPDTVRDEKEITDMLLARYNLPIVVPAASCRTRRLTWWTRPGRACACPP